jgi:membrane protein
MVRKTMGRYAKIRKFSGGFFRGLGLLWRALVNFYDDNGFFLASGITFNILITLIPFIILLLAVVGSYLHNDQQVLGHVRAYLRSAVPTMDPRIMSNLMDVIERRQAIGLLGFAGLVWFSTWFFASLRVALHIVLKVARPRGMLHAFGIDLLMVGAVGSLFLANMAVSSLFAFLQGYPGWIQSFAGPVIQLMLRYLFPLFLTFCVFCLVYKVIPYEAVSIRSTLKVALFTSLLWEGAKHLFAWYVANIAEYSLFYSSLSALVVFVLWIYYSSTIFIVGGELLYLLEKDPTAGPDIPAG